MNELAEMLQAGYDVEIHWFDYGIYMTVYYKHGMVKTRFISKDNICDLENFKAALSRAFKDVNEALKEERKYAD